MGKQVTHGAGDEMLLRARNKTLGARQEIFAAAENQVQFHTMIRPHYCLHPRCSNIVEGDAFCDDCTKTCR